MFIFVLEIIYTKCIMQKFLLITIQLNFINKVSNFIDNITHSQKNKYLDIYINFPNFKLNEIQIKSFPHLYITYIIFSSHIPTHTINYYSLIVL